jgi:hypothetical protein
MSKSLPDLPVLSIRQPWACLILHAGKDIENRVWRTHQRGRFLIHAAKGCTRAEYESACEYSRLCGFRGEIPDLKHIERGGIVGSVELVECVDAHASRWFVGPFGFVLRDPQPIPFHPCTGQLGFFRLNQ